jgi:hypothetical protein
MWRKDLGFRVGQVRTAAGNGTGRGLGGFSSRCYEENADKAWVLHACKTKEEARTLEAVEAAKFGLPTCVFTAQNHHLLRKQNLTKIFKAVSWSHGFDCLKSRGLLFEHPLFGDGNPNQRYFKTVAANLVAGLFSMPTTTPFKPEPIAEIMREPYNGPVYSMDVRKYHTYVADGIPVGNCIYEWRNATADSLSTIQKYFIGTNTLYLGNNYRSTGAIVAFLKKIIPVDNGLASHMVSMREWGVDPTFTQYDDDLQEVVHVLYQINEAKDLNNTAIIARTNRQLRTFQKAAMALGIKTMILGQKDLWQKDEVKHLLELTKKFKDSGRKAYDVMEEQMRLNNLTHIYRNAGGPNEKPPVENLADIVKLSANRGTVKEFLDWLRKLTYACEAAKSPSYEHRDKNPTLTLTTVHQAKGREYKNVYVIGCKQGTMPHKEGEILEEKRIFFVAASRAADNLHISFDTVRSEFLNDFQEEIKYHEQKPTEKPEPTPVGATVGQAGGATIFNPR